MATPIVEFHHDPHNGGFFTTSLFWDCECEQCYIHDLTEGDCPVCGVQRQDAPDARAIEVVQHAHSFHLSSTLVEVVAEQVEMDRIPF